MNILFSMLNANNTISVNRHLSHAIGLQETVLYQSLLAKNEYYTANDMLSEDGWFYCTADDLEESTSLSWKVQNRVIGILIKLNLIETKLKGMPAIKYFKINNDVTILASLIEKGQAIIEKKHGRNKNRPKGETRIAQREKQESPKGRNSNLPKGETSFAQRENKSKDNQSKDINPNIIQSINHTDTPDDCESELELLKPIDGLKKEDIQYIIKDELLEKKYIPYGYGYSISRITEAVHFSTDWHIFYPKGYKDDLEQSTYNLFNSALIEMCCFTNKPLRVKGRELKYNMVIAKINELAEFCDDYISISSIQDTAIKDYITATNNRHIINPLQYMIACIWTAMQIGDITMQSDVKKITEKNKNNTEEEIIW